MINPFLIIKKRFLSRKDKEKAATEVVVKKPEDQVIQEGAPFYHREPKKAKHITIFTSYLEARERRRSKLRTRMQKRSRRINRIY